MKASLKKTLVVTVSSVAAVGVVYAGYRLLGGNFSSVVETAAEAGSVAAEAGSEVASAVCHAVTDSVVEIVS